MYACGSASALTILGLLTAYVGGVFGSAASFGDLPTLMTGMVAVAMGLNLLELVQFSLPSLDFYPAFQKSFQQIPWSVQAFAFGASASLISSPCSSPVLASLLAIVASLGDPTLGALYLFAFSLGYSTPVVVAVSQSLSLASSTRGFQSVNTAFGAALIAFGTYSTLDGAFKMLL
jgi:cytochrome c-type biogenesis protein